MESIEFITELTAAGVLPIPPELAAQITTCGKVRVIIMSGDLTDDGEWRTGSYQQFLRDDSEEDAIYETCR